jgi:hypothetical protein
MKSTYSIIFRNIEIPLFKLNYDHKNEGSAVQEFEIMMYKERDRVAEDVIRDLFAKYRGRHDSVSDPIELLRILLANQYNIRLHRDQYIFDLCKDHFPISFEARSGSRTVKFGDYYRTSTSTADEQFVSFSNWLGELSGMKEMNRLMGWQLINSGFSIVAYEQGKETILVNSDTHGNIISGQEATLEYLLGKKSR